MWGQEQNRCKDKELPRHRYLREILRVLLRLLPLPPVFQQPPEFDVEKEDVLLQGAQLLLHQEPLVTPGLLVQRVLQGQAVHLQLPPPQGTQVLLLHLEQKKRDGVTGTCPDLAPKPRVSANGHPIRAILHMGRETQKLPHV